MAKHAKLSASNTKRWWICPGSQAWIEAYVEGSPSGYAAKQGTAAHALVERCLTRGEEPSDYEGRVIRILNPDTDKEGTSILRKGAKAQDGDDFEVDSDMSDAVSVMTDYIRTRCEELGIGPDMVGVELESWTLPLPDREDSGGTADVTIDAWPTLLEVVDYKHGAGIYVPVTNNHQTRSYLLGKAIESGFSHDRYRHVIVQPRCSEAPDVAYEELTRDELLEFQRGLEEAAERVDNAREFVAAGATLGDLQAGAYLSVGEDGSPCTFCDLRRGDLCPEARDHAARTAGVDFGDEPTDVEVPDGTDIEMLARLLDWVPFLDRWIKGIKEGALELAAQGREIPGYKLVRGRSNRRWVDLIDDEPVEEAELAKLVAEQFGLELATLFTEPGLKSGPQVEKLIRGKDSKDRKAEFSSVFLAKPPGKIALAKEADPRDVVEPDSQDFSDFEDDADV